MNPLCIVATSVGNCVICHKDFEDGSVFHVQPFINLCLAVSGLKVKSNESKKHTVSLSFRLRQHTGIIEGNGYILVCILSLCDDDNSSTRLKAQMIYSAFWQLYGKTVVNRREEEVAFSERKLHSYSVRTELEASSALEDVSTPSEWIQFLRSYVRPICRLPNLEVVWLTSIQSQVGLTVKFACVVNAMSGTVLLTSSENWRVECVSGVLWNTVIHSASSLVQSYTSPFNPQSSERLRRRQMSVNNVLLDRLYSASGVDRKGIVLGFKVKEESVYLVCLRIVRLVEAACLVVFIKVDRSWITERLRGFNSSKDATEVIPHMLSASAAPGMKKGTDSMDALRMYSYWRNGDIFVEPLSFLPEPLSSLIEKSGRCISKLYPRHLRNISELGKGLSAAASCIQPHTPKNIPLHRNPRSRVNRSRIEKKAIEPRPPQDKEGHERRFRRHHSPELLKIGNP